MIARRSVSAIQGSELSKSDRDSCTKDVVEGLLEYFFSDNQYSYNDQNCQWYLQNLKQSEVVSIDTSAEAFTCCIGQIIPFNVAKFFVSQILGTSKQELQNSVQLDTTTPSNVLNLFETKVCNYMNPCMFNNRLHIKCIIIQKRREVGEIIVKLSGITDDFAFIPECHCIVLQKDKHPV